MIGHLDNAPCLYFAFTDEGELLETNKAFKELLGYTNMDQPMLMLQHVFDVPTRIFFQTHWFPLLKLQGYANELSVAVVTKEHKVVPLLVNSTRSLTNGREITQVIGLVIANRVKHENALINARTEYQQALAQNTELSSARQELREHAERIDRGDAKINQQDREFRQINKIVTHDLQEPIRKLHYFIEQLNSELGDASPSVAKLIGRVRAMSENLQAVISGLQQYIWLTELYMPPAAVDLNAILHAAKAELINRFGEENFNLHLAILPEVPGNAELLLAMFLHLLDNAVRFRKPNEKAEITIQCSIVDQNKSEQASGRYRFEKYVRISIEDNGTGIDPVLHDQVFELFYRNNNAAGAGLGLGLSRKVVEHHSGTLELDSEPGKGATIYILLPLN